MFRSKWAYVHHQSWSIALKSKINKPIIYVRQCEVLAIQVHNLIYFKLQWLDLIRASDEYYTFDLRATSSVDGSWAIEFRYNIRHGVSTYTNILGPFR